MSSESWKPIFIGGCDRSGTTLLGSLLGGHSDCVCTPESQFLAPVFRVAETVPDVRQLVPLVENHWRFRLWGISRAQSAADWSGASSVQEVVRALVQSYAAAQEIDHVTRWVDHTPANLKRAAALLRYFPQSRFVHLVRDGRGVAASIIPLPWGPNNCLSAARWWANRVEACIEAETVHGPNRVLRVHYEDLLNHPHETLEKICRFVNLEFEPRMLSNKGFKVPRYTARQHRLVGLAVEPDRATAWHQLLSARQIRCFEQAADTLLEKLGYELMFPDRKRRLGDFETLGLSLHDSAWSLINRFRLRRHRGRFEN